MWCWEHLTVSAGGKVNKTNLENVQTGIILTLLSLISRKTKLCTFCTRVFSNAQLRAFRILENESNTGPPRLLLCRMKYRWRGRSLCVYLYARRKCHKSKDLNADLSPQSGGGKGGSINGKNTPFLHQNTSSSSVLADGTYRCWHALHAFLHFSQRWLVFLTLTFVPVFYIPLIVSGFN